MKVLVLTKRHHMGQDAFGQLHGRSFAIPEILATAMDTEIRGIIADYHPQTAASASPPQSAVDWLLIPVRSGAILRFDRYWLAVRKAIRDFRPDVVWAGADAPITIIGQHLAARQAVPCVIDLKDNYESFRLTRLPGIRSAFHRAIRNAQGVTCASSRLLEYARNLGADRYGYVLPNAADGAIFRPMPTERARQELGLPLSYQYIGTAGALTRDRNIAVLSDAARLLANRVPNIALLVAGPQDETWNPPLNLPVYNLGPIIVSRVALLFNALDLGVICNRPGAFGSYCYPQKFHEMRACNLPVLAARVGPFENPEAGSGITETFSPDSASELSDLLEKRLAYESRPSTESHAATWHDRAAALDRVFQELGDFSSPPCQ